MWKMGSDAHFPQTEEGISAVGISRTGWWGLVMDWVPWSSYSMHTSQALWGPGSWSPHGNREEVWRTLWEFDLKMCCCSLSCVFFAAGMAFIVLCVQVEITSDRLFGLLELHLSLKVFRPDSFCSAWVNVSVNWIFLCFYVFIPSIPSHPNHITHAPETQGVCLNAVSARVWFWL